MFKTQIILIAIAISWFLCSERPETDAQLHNDETIKNEADTMTETDGDASKENSTGITRIKGWVRLSTMAALVVIVLRGVR